MDNEDYKKMNDKLNDKTYKEHVISPAYGISMNLGITLEDELFISDYLKIIKDNYVYNAFHDFRVCDRNSNNVLQNIHFQSGPILENGVNGITMESLIMICIDKLRSFQKSEFACCANEVAINFLESALMALNERTFDRKRRDKEGKYEK